MSMFVLLTGVLHKAAVPRTSHSGKEFTTANIRVEQDGTTQWVNVIAFDQAAQDELKRLDAGDVVSVQGKLKASVYEKDGEHRPSLDVVGAVVVGLTPKSQNPSKPRAKSRQIPPRQAVDSVGDMRKVYGRPDEGFDDDLSF